MAKLRIEINIDNAAFGVSAGLNPEIECARILRKLANDYEIGLSPTVLRDYNGNVVGFSAYKLNQQECSCAAFGPSECVCGAWD